MDEKLKDKNRESKVSMIGPLSALLAALITAFANLPAIIQYIMVLLISVIAVVSVYVVFGQQFIRFFKKTTMATKHHFLAKKYFSEFNGFVDRLGELLKDNRCDNIPYVFIHLRNTPAEFNDLQSSMYYVGDLLAVFKEGMKKFHKRDFKLVLKWFESILRLYNKQLVLQPFQRVRNLYKDKLTDPDKEAYQKNREDYVQFLQDYMNFARAINKDFSEKVANDYFEKPGIL